MRATGCTSRRIQASIGYSAVHIQTAFPGMTVDAIQGALMTMAQPGRYPLQTFAVLGDAIGQRVPEALVSVFVDGEDAS
jgi:hypothetical protein